MSFQEKSREELLELAEKYELKVPKGMTTTKLMEKVELVAIERHERITEQVREKMKNEAIIKRRVAEIKVSAELVGIDIKVPEKPTIVDVIRLEKELGIKKKAPKPSPETVAIESSKKAYAVFRNLEQEDVDIVASVGGKYRFHFWPDKVHVLPLWLINHYRSKKNPSGTRPYSQYKEVQGHKTIAAGMTRTERKQRFTFEIIGDAPDDAEFGMVTDEAILSKLEQHV